MTSMLDLAGILIKYITNALDITPWWIFSLQIWRNESQGRDMEIFYCRIIIEWPGLPDYLYFWVWSWVALSLYRLITVNLLGWYSHLNVLQFWSNEIEFPISHFFLDWLVKHNIRKRLEVEGQIFFPSLSHTPKARGQYLDQWECSTLIKGIKSLFFTTIDNNWR